MRMTMLMNKLSLPVIFYNILAAVVYGRILSFIIHTPYLFYHWITLDCKTFTIFINSLCIMKSTVLSLVHIAD